MNLTPKQVLAIRKGNEEIAAHFRALLVLIAKLEDTVAAKDQRIEELAKQVHDLKRQLSQNSQNSNKPPSSAGPPQTLT